METRIPAPALVVLVGPSSSGKSTWAQGRFAPEEVVSSDHLRETVGLSRTDQSASEDAFDLLERIVDMRTGRNLTVVIDTMGFDPGRRRRWIDRAHEKGLGAYAIVFDTPDEECLRRNDARPDAVPRSVLRRQLSRFGDVVEELEHDGFDGILTRGSIAVVAPQFAAPSPSDENTARHTFGLILSRFNWPGDSADRAAQLASIARRAESSGFRDLWVMDHFRQIPQVGRAWEDIPESYTTLAYLAGVTSRIRLGALVTGVTYRNPAHLGKIVATLDVVSGGRAVCGIGLGWDEAEHRAYGWEFPPTSERYELLEDALQLLPLVWGKGTPEFAGRVVDADSLACYPRPVQEKIPILVGGSGERRTLRLVARYADACNFFGRPERVRQKVEVLRGHCADLGRSPDDIEVTHLTTVLAARDRQDLRDRIDAVRNRAESRDAYARSHNAGTVDDLTSLFEAYAAAGASHSIIAMPDVHLDDSLETFADVIRRFDPS